MWTESCLAIFNIWYSINYISDHFPNEIFITCMKGDLEKQAEGPQHPEGSKETKLGNLPPHEQERLLKAESGKLKAESYIDEIWL